MSSTNKALFAAWVERGIKPSLIPELKNVELTQEMVKENSVYNSVATWNMPRIRFAVVSAVCKIHQIMNSTNNDCGAIGVVQQGDEQGFAVEIVEGGVRQAAVIFNQKTYATKDGSSYVFKDGHDSGVLLLATVMVAESFANNQELCAALSRALQCLNSGNLKADAESFATACAVLGENLYRRLVGTKDAISTEVFNSQGNVLKLTPLHISSGKFIPTSTMYGKFVILDKDDGNDSDSSQEAETESQPEDYRLNPSRAFSEEEQRMIPEIEPWYVMPDEVLEICALAKKTTNTYKPKRNFMFRGPSSTGKTSMTRAIAAKLGLPYVYVTCSSDTESYTFLGQPMYDTDGTVRYVESDFVKAIKNGWVVEVQEPYVISKQGVLTALNGLLDDGNGITLATGEYVTRHPDCIVVFTTNVSYVGCKKPNQSVLRRMNNVYDIDMPSKVDIIKRVESVTGFTDKSVLSSMVDVLGRINRYCEEQAVDDGVCGVSELIDWVFTFQVTGDVVKAAKTTIVSKATDDADCQTGILGLVESQFKNVTIPASDTNIADRIKKSTSY